MKKITEFCELPQFNFVYKKDHVIFNKEGIDEILGTVVRLKNKNKNYAINSEYGKIFEFSKISNKNIPHDNDSEIKKYLSAELEEMDYT